MIILGIETSCDETAAAVITNNDKRITILSNIVASSAQLQDKYGGVIPEQAAREQIKSIIPVIEEALNQAFPNVIPSKEGIYNNMDPRLRGDDNGSRDDGIKKIDAIAVTYGPGLIGSLLVGVETAKVLATVWDKPLIPVNHLLGHFYANWIAPSSVIARNPERVFESKETEQSPQSMWKIATGRTVWCIPRNDNTESPTFPCVGLLVSGGHTDLLLFKNHGKYEHLGGTRDDAAGECFDKCARLLGLPYPGGPAIAKLAKFGKPNAFNLPRPMIDSLDFDFSFSGLKTAVANILKVPRGERVPQVSRGLLTRGTRDTPTTRDTRDLAASIETAIIDVLVAKTIRAARTYKVDQIMIAGGVAANQSLIRNLKFKIKNLKLKAKLFVPPPELCTDNAAMIASAAFFNYQPINPLKLQANPNLSLDLN